MKANSVKSPQILATNLRGLMNKTEGLRTQAQVAKGAGVSQTSISLMLRPDDRALTKSGKSPSPRLAEVEAVANAFGMEAWQILIDPDTLGETLFKAFSGPAAKNERLEKGGIKPAIVGG